MDYTIIAVFCSAQDGTVSTCSRITHTNLNPRDEKEKIIGEVLTASHFSMDELCEVFVLKSAQNYGSAPEMVEHWTPSNGDFDDDDDMDPDYQGDEDVG